MGLLDDAIREHLELKRRHGADPDEVAREEREALGAARARGEFASGETATAAEGADESTPAGGDEPDVSPFGVAEPEEFAPFGDEGPATADEAVGAPFGDEEPATPPAGADEARAWAAPDEPASAPEAPAAPRAGAEDPGGAPFNVEDDAAPAEPEVPAPGGEAGAPGYDEDPWLEEERDEVPAEESLDRPSATDEEREDVLEETPDFLQETPEHDRLWFEQRPPRDFDWDK
jgi:hypothetical protein